MRQKLISSVLFILIAACGAFAQTTEFTYQGSLSTSGSPANVNHDFEFALFDALAGGAQIGSTLPRNTVAVTNGIFSVKLDFGNLFPGANRFLEIRVRPSGVGAFTTLAPRQLVNSAPYSVKSLNADNATQLGGVAANQYVTTTTGGANFIQNTTSPQASSNFSISGNGFAGGTFNGNIINADTQYNLNNFRVLSGVPGTLNLFAGINTGSANTGSGNSFFGAGTGQANTIGSGNSFVGSGTGSTNTTGNSNTLIGSSANVGTNNLSFATAVGSGAVVSASNTIALGRSNGSDTVVIPGTFNVSGNGTVGGTFNGNIINADTQYNLNNFRVLSGVPGTLNLFAGIMTGSATTGAANSFFGAGTGSTNTTGNNNTLIGSSTDVGSNNLTNATAIGANTVVNASNKVRIGNGNVTVIEGQVAYTFTSDKNQKENFLAVNGSDVLRKIRGFNMTSWNYIGQDAKQFRHYGPMAQDFYAAFGRDAYGTFGSPTTVNTGDMAGVTLAAIKELSTENEALKEQISGQQAQIEQQQKLIETQQRQIDSMKKFICLTNKGADFCKE